MVKIKPALFLHFQKSSGISIVDLARHSHGLGKVVSHGDYLNGRIGIDLEKIANARGKSPGVFKAWLLFQGNLTLIL
jgi:hypothetical protein